MVIVRTAITTANQGICTCVHLNSFRLVVTIVLQRPPGGSQMLAALHNRQL
jgi:hypothetical protein